VEWTDNKEKRKKKVKHPKIYHYPWAVVSIGVLVLQKNADNIFCKTKSNEKEREGKGGDPRPTNLPLAPPSKDYQHIFLQPAGCLEAIG
jgi:hypothetical protein